MRRAPLLSAVAGIALIAACGKREDSTPPAPPPPPPPAATNQVNIRLKCDNDGADIDVHPWRIKVYKADGVLWHAPQDSVWIAPKDSTKWPFDKDTIKVASGAKVPSTNFKQSVDTGTYKYKIIGICNNTSGVDTVVLDPDMIIPTRIQK